MAKAKNDDNNQQNGHRLEQTTAILQQAMATLLQNQTLFVARVEELKDRMDHKFAEVDRRLQHIEALLQQMFAELPEKVFGFGQAAQKKQG
jgi:hypothetical protein